MSYLTNAVVVTGADPTGTADSTAAFNAAIAALPTTGGSIIVPYTSAHYKLNLVITQSGVNIIGAGLSPQGTGNFLRAFDTTKPVIQIGATAGNVVVKSVALHNITFDGANSCQYGLSFKGGAQYCHAYNMQIWNFTNRCLEFTNADASPCEYNKIFGLVVESSATGSNGIVFEDLHVAGSGWTTACYIDGFDVQVSSGAPAFGTYGGHPVVVDGADAILANGYVQMSNNGHGLLYKKSNTYTPHLTLSNVNFDNSAGASTIAITIDTAYDLRANTSNAGHIVPFHGITGGSSNGCKTFFVAGHTTGSITTGTNTLTVASATGITTDRQIQVVGAGATGKLLIANVTAVSGTTITLSTNAGTTVSSVDVAYGNTTTDMGFKGDNSAPYLTAPGMYLSFTGKTRLEAGSHKGQLFHISGAGSFAPFNATNFIWDLGSDGLNIFQDNGAGTSISSGSQSGTTVTINTAAAHNTSVNQYVTIDGAVEAGINGTFQVLSIPSSTQLTYTSTVSQSLGSITGSPTIRFDSMARFSGNRLDLGPRGLGMLDNLGNYNKVLSQTTTNANFNVNTPNTTSGQYIFASGNTQSTSNHAFGFYAGSAGSNSEICYLNTQGNFYLIKSAAPTTNSAGAFIYADTNGRWRTHDAAGLNGTMLSSITNRNTQSGNYTLLAADYYVVYTGTGGNTFTLPAATTAGRTYLIKHNGTGVLTIDGNGSDTLDLVVNITLNPTESRLIVADGSTNWEIN